MTEPGPRLIVTAGDPAGIGPDICLALAADDPAVRFAVVGDPDVLQARAQALGLDVTIGELSAADEPGPQQPGHLQVIAQQAPAAVVAGRPDPANASMVLAGLDIAVAACIGHRYDAMVTAPVSKAVLSRPERPFSGHTEYLAAAAGHVRTVMMLCADQLRVALVTTHLPLRAVADAITQGKVESTIRIVHAALTTQFSIARPRILVCGLNPHAGESGQLGREEIETIAPALDRLRAEGLLLTGPLPADTLFVPDRVRAADAVVAMYHDQGLPVLKYAGFGTAVNVTLGLPFVRTSVDHGTAFDIAGTGRADPGSLRAAMRMAARLAPTCR